VTVGPALEKMPSKYWPIVALLIYLVGSMIVMGASSLTGGSWDFNGYQDPYQHFGSMTLVLMLVTFLMIGAAMYLMLERRRAHLDREVRLVNSIIDYVHKVADARGVPLTLGPYTGVRFERDTRDASPKMVPGSSSSPVFWGVVVVSGPVLAALFQILLDQPEHLELVLLAVLALAVGILLFLAFIYMMVRWTNEMESHDERWGRFAEATGTALHRLGYDVQSLPARRRLPSRSTAGYTILSIVFNLIFISIWISIIIDDQTRHLKWQRNFERSFLDLIEPGSRR